MTVAVTGSTGYIGGALVRALAAGGWSVVELSRRPSGHPGVQGWRPYRLENVVADEHLEGVETVVHAAWDLSAHGREAWDRNVGGSVALLERLEGRRLIFVSSMSAYVGTRQPYGLMKLAVESVAERVGGCSIRPGMVYGPSPGGMVGALTRMAQWPVTPIVAGRSKLHTTHVDDLAQGVIRLIGLRQPAPAVLPFAHRVPLSFKRIMVGLAESTGQTRLRLVPIPWRPLYLALLGLEALKMEAPFRSDSLLGLVRPAPPLVTNDLQESLGILFRAFEPEASNEPD